MLSNRALQSLAFDCFFPDQTDDAQELSKLGEIDLYSPKDERNFRNDEIKAMLTLAWDESGRVETTARVRGRTARTKGHPCSNARRPAAAPRPRLAARACSSISLATP